MESPTTLPVVTPVGNGPPSSSPPLSPPTPSDLSLCHSLFKWVQTFELSVPTPRSVADLSDGVIVAHCLALVDPDFFDADWLSRLKTEVPAANWRLKLSNLKKVLKGMLDFYADVLGQHIRDFHTPDLAAIAERADPVETGRLLQLVLGCAVNCDKKQRYIEEIMGMEEAVQHVVMNAIQELMNKETPLSSDGEALHAVTDQLKKTVDDLNQAMSAKEELLQRCHELDFQVASLQEENLHLKSEQSKWNRRSLGDADEIEDPSTPVGRKFLQLQQQIETLQESLEILESQKEDLLIKADVHSREMQEVQSRNEELVGAVEESAALKDELDVLRDQSVKAEKMEGVIETYRRKLEDAVDVRRQLKILEEKNAAYVEKNLGLEEELKKTSSLKTQLESYKRQTQELQLAVSEASKRSDRLEFENRRNAEKLAVAVADRANLQKERESLRETVEEMTLVQSSGVVGEGSRDDLESSVDQMDFLSMPPSIKEKFIRLQRENRVLKTRLGRRSSDESFDSSKSPEGAPFLRDRLEDAEGRVKELEEENRAERRKVMELEAALEDAKSQLDDASTRASSLKKDLSSARVEADKKRSSTDDFSDAVQRLEAETETWRRKSEETEERLKREKEMAREMEERYKRYLEKAKTVIKTLDPRGTAAASPLPENGQAISSDNESLAKRLAESQAQIGRLQQENHQIKQNREKEDRLIHTAWYSISAQLAKKGGDERLASFVNGASPAAAGAGGGGAAAGAAVGVPPLGQSFLAKQRQTHLRRLTLPSGSGS